MTDKAPGADLVRVELAKALYATDWPHAKTKWDDVGENGHWQTRYLKMADTAIALRSPTTEAMDDAIYQSAVKGRADFRSAFREEREKTKMLTEVVQNFANEKNWYDNIANLQWAGKRHAIEYAQSVLAALSKSPSPPDNGEDRNAVIEECALKIDEMEQKNREDSEYDRDTYEGKYRAEALKFAGQCIRALKSQQTTGREHLNQV